MRIILALIVLFFIAACQPAETIPEPEPDAPEPEPASFCGDGQVQAPNDEGLIEECDRGDRNGEECTAPYGGSCTYCTETCQELSVEGGFCGDGVCDSYESFDVCETDCERVFEEPTETGLIYYLAEVELNGEGVVVEEDVDVTESFTIAAWVNRAEQTNGYIVARDEIGADTRGGYALRVDRAGFVAYETNDLAEASGKLGEVPVGEWTHVAVTYERRRVPQLRIIVNGELSRAHNGITPPHDLETPLLIGRRGQDPAYPFV